MTVLFLQGQLILYVPADLVLYHTSWEDWMQNAWAIYFTALDGGLEFHLARLHQSLVFSN